MRAIFVILSTLVLLLFSCGERNEISSVLLDAETISYDYPDSGRVILEGMRPDEQFDDYNSAYYYLLLTDAKYRSHSPLQGCDSLLNIAFDTFDAADNELLLGRVWMYRGRVWERLYNSPAEATDCFHKAIKIAERHNDYLTLTRSYDGLGLIYRSQDLIDDALEMFTKCYHLDLAQGIDSHIALALRRIGTTYFFLSDFDTALQYLEQALTYAKGEAVPAYILDALYNDLAICYSDTGNPEKALEYSRMCRHITPENWQTRAGIFYQMERYDSARYYFNHCIAEPGDSDPVASYYFLYKMDYQEGKYRSACQNLDEYYTRYDSINSHLLTGDVVAIKKRHKMEVALMEVANKHKIEKIIFSFGFGMLLFVVVIVYLVYDRRRRREQEQQTMAILTKEKEVSELHVRIATIQTDIARLQTEKKDSDELHSVVFQKEDEIVFLYEKIVELECHIFKSKPIYKKITGVKKRGRANNGLECFNSQERVEIRQEVLSSLSLFVGRLKSICSALSDDDIFFCCLFRLQLTTLQICACLGVDGTNLVRQRRYRIRRKMTDDCNSENMYVAIFETVENLHKF